MLLLLLSSAPRAIEEMHLTHFLASSILTEIFPTTTTTTTTTPTTTTPSTTRNTKNPEYRYEADGQVSNRQDPHNPSRHHDNDGRGGSPPKGGPYAQSREDNKDWRTGNAKNGGGGPDGTKSEDPYRGETDRYVKHTITIVIRAVISVAAYRTASLQDHQ